MIDATAPDERQLTDLLGRLDLEQKVALLSGRDFWSLHPIPAIGLRRLVTSDGPAGVRGERWDEADPSANVPSPTALAASWDEQRVERLGRLLAAEARRKGVDVLLAPTVNLHRTPYGGRHFECFSEDPYLTARMAVAYIRGVQGGRVAATIKHLVGNDSETARMTVDVRVDERTLREAYLAPFEAAVREAGVWALMAAYNSLDGTTMTEHPLLRDVVDGEWGFDGVIMSDWYATRSVQAAGEAGLDLAMPGPVTPWTEGLLAAVRAGEVSEARVDEKVLRLLRLAARVGALEGIAPAVTVPEQVPDSGSDPQVAALLRETAAAGFVLARNEPVEGEGPLLPLDPHQLRRVAVIGPNAAVARTLGGGSATVFPPYTVSPLAGLRAALEPGVEVAYTLGAYPHTRLPVADPALVTDPDQGTPGVSVRLLGPGGVRVATQHRRTGRCTWLISFGPGIGFDQVATVEVAATLHAESAGTYTVGCSGLGRFELRVGDEVRLDGELSLPSGRPADLDDPGEALVRPPQQGVPVPLAAGEQVEVRLRHQVQPGFVGVSFQLNVEAPRGTDEEELAAAEWLAAESDVAVVVVGTTEEVESEGFDRVSLELPGRQAELVARVAAANPRTVVVVNSGAPVLLPWLDEVPATLLAWFPGQEAGHALADVLLGRAEPGGRLPTTWPAAGAAAADLLPATRPTGGRLAYTEGLDLGYRRWERAGLEPALPFGHGLGYTTWAHEQLEAPASLQPGDDLTVQVQVANTGPRRGREVVQVYLSCPDSGVTRPVRWLAGFAGATLDPGERAWVEVAVPARAFAHWDPGTHAWVHEQVRFVVYAGRSARDLPLRAEVTVGR